MNGLRALVVEDVLLMRSALVDALRARPEIAQVDAADCAKAASALLAQHAYDIVFLDIHLPDGLGVDLGVAAKAQGVPSIVYCTADATYAIEALRQQAADYLLKPVTQSAVDQALERATRRISDSPRTPQPLAVRDGARIRYIAPDLIERVEAAGHYQCVYAQGEVHLLRQSSAQIAEQLGPGFVRVQRATIVRAAAIRSLETERSGDGTLHLDSGAKVRFSRTCRAAIEAALGPG